jgi:hypothetical protein
VDDRDQTEREVRSRLERDLRSLSVRPYAEYRFSALERMRRSRGPLRLASALAATVAVILLALLLGNSLADVRRNAAALPSPSAVASSTPTAPPLGSTTPAPSATSPTTAIAVSCGQVRRRVSDGARMLLTLGVGGTTTTYNLEYQFASVRPAPDVGSGTPGSQPPFVLVYGREVPPDSGSPEAVSLRDFTATQVADCPGAATVGPAAFTGFLPPPSCSYVGGPSLAADHSDRFVDCGPTGNRAARDTLASALIEQGWSLCGFGAAAATWAKGATSISIAESSLAPGDFPRLTQTARSVSCP